MAAQRPLAVQSILDNINNQDRDISHVGLCDLNALLKNEAFKNLQEWEERIVNIILGKLTDQSGTIQNLATTCLGSLTARGLRDAYLERICTKLMDMLVSTKPEERSVGQAGLKAVIADTPFNLAHVCVRSLTQRIIQGVSQTATQIGCLETLLELIKKFGSAMPDDHPRIQECLLQTLSTARTELPRKKCLAGIALLSCCINNSLFDALLNQFIANVGRGSKLEKRQAIQVIGGVSREAGGRAGKYLDRLVPLIISASQTLGDDAADEEIREGCVEACNSFIVKCPGKEIIPHLQPIVDFCVRNLSYDPNYQADEDEEEEDEDGEDASDDEDMSWKSRRAAARCLGSIIRNHLELLTNLYGTVAAPLIQRFKERVDHVRLSVFAAFMELLAQTDRANKLRLVDGRALLRPHAPVVCQLLCGLLPKNRHVETRTGAFEILKQVAAILGGGLDAQFPLVAGVIVKLFKEKGIQPQLKTVALDFLGPFCELHAPPVVAPQAGALIPLLIASCGDAYYKLASEALRCLASLVRTVRPAGAPSDPLKAHAKPLFAAILARLNQPDQDQEVKQAAISSTGLVIAHIGDLLADETRTTLPILLERCRNEITRTSAVRTLLTIANSPLRIDLRPILADLITEGATFLRKNNRTLVQTTIGLLDSLVRTYGDAIRPPQTAALMTECGALINDRDLHLAALALGLVDAILSVQRPALAQAKESILPHVMTLTQSTLLQGPALVAVQGFFVTLVKMGEPAQTHIAALLGSITAQTQKHAYGSIAQCIGAIAVHGGASAVQSVVGRFVTELKTPATPTEKALLALLCIGQIGRLQDLSSSAELRDVVLGKLDSPLEEVQMGASFCFGNLAAGAVAQYVPVLLDLVHKQPKWQYLLMHSTKELIAQCDTTARAEALAPFLEPLSQALVTAVERTTEEGVRNTAAECLGRLAVLRPAQFLPVFERSAASPNANVRYGIAHAVKHALAEGAQPLDAPLAQSLPSLLRLLQDPDLTVRREAMLLVKSLVMLKPPLIRDPLPSIMPTILQETAVKQDLRRIVEMGPFKEIVDSGLPLRKATYETLEVVLAVLPELADLPATIQRMVVGLGDDYDIALKSHPIMTRLTELAGEAVLAQAPGIVAAVAKTIEAKLKIIAHPSTIPQDAEKAEELIRACLRLIAAMEALPGHEQNAEFLAFLGKTIRTPPIKPRYDAIVADKEAKKLEASKSG